MLLACRSRIDQNWFRRHERDMNTYRLSSPVLTARSIAKLAVLVVAMSIVAGLSSRPVAAQSKLESLTIETATGAKRFDIEVMRTDEERERGLMFRAYLPPTRGMLFDFKAPEKVMMWMKDTLIPLDMIFIRANGTIARIAENTEPYSTRTISSGEPVLGVLEINGGAAAIFGIKAGDVVTYPLFKR